MAILEDRMESLRKCLLLPDPMELFRFRIDAWSAAYEAPPVCPTRWSFDEPFSPPDIKSEYFEQFLFMPHRIPLFTKFPDEPFGRTDRIDDPDPVSAFMNRVARRKDDYRGKNKELRVTAPLEYEFLDPLMQMGFNKIVEIAPTYIVLTEDKSREEEDSQKKTILSSANDSHEVASDITLMQRENYVASSSKPCNLICSQTPGGVTSAVVQTPSETACERGPEWAFPSSPAGMGNDNEVAGLQGFCAVPEIPQCGIQSRKKLHYASDSDEFPSRRLRAPNWTDEETSLMLQLKSEFLQDPANEGKRHEWSKSVSDSMKKDGYDRDPKTVQRWSDTIKKSYEVLKNKFPLGTSYWDMTMDEKKAYKKDHDRHFPLTFKPELVVAMANVKKLESSRAVKKSETRRDGRDGVFTQSLPSAITGLANFAGAEIQDPAMKLRFKHLVLAVLPSSADCLQETGDKPDLESEATDIPTDEEVSSGESGASVESHTEIASADSHGPRTEPSRKRSAVSAFDEEFLFAKMRPFVNQQIEEALLPLINALRSREEDDHNHRQKMLALERQKLAFMRQKLECSRRS